MYEYLEHTADVGIRIDAATLEEALADAGRAFSSLIVENLDDVRLAEEVRIELPPPGDAAEALDYLLFDWLSALLGEFESTRRVFREFDIRAERERIVARCRGEALDPGRHQLGHEVKAITYHQLEFRRTDRGYCGQVIVDL
jgi:SHS2 domain-containing protein